MQVTLWTNKSKEFCATVWDGKKALYSVAYKTIEQRTKFVNKNKLSIV